MTDGMGWGVTAYDVGQGASDCKTTAEEVEQQLQAVRNYVAGLRSQWQGVAALNFDALMADFDAYGVMLHNALMNISTGLMGNYNNYVSVEEFAANNMVAVNGDIPGAYL
jgi:WXG100 family type VII secretion target